MKKKKSLCVFPIFLYAKKLSSENEIFIEWKFLEFHQARKYKSLQLSGWALGDPLLDAFEGQNVVDHLLQAWISGGEVALRHEVQVIENSNEVQVSPCQLKWKEKINN